MEICLIELLHKKRLSCKQYHLTLHSSKYFHYFSSSDCTKCSKKLIFSKIFKHPDPRAVLNLGERKIEIFFFSILRIKRNFGFSKIRVSTVLLLLWLELDYWHNHKHETRLFISVFLVLAFIQYFHVSLFFFF